MEGKCINELFFSHYKIVRCQWYTDRSIPTKASESIGHDPKTVKIYYTRNVREKEFVENVMEEPKGEAGEKDKIGGYAVGRNSQKAIKREH